jgi:hypothetical protein
LRFAPTQEEIIQCTKRAPKCRGMKAPIVTNSNSDHRLNPFGDLLQGEVIALMHPPGLALEPNSLFCLKRLRYANKRLLIFKGLRSVEFVEEIPMTVTDKPRRVG